MVNHTIAFTDVISAGVNVVYKTGSITRGNINGEAIVFHTNLLILSLFLFWTLLKLRHIFARLRTPSEWCHGLFLYHTTPRRPRRVARSISHRSAKKGGSGGGAGAGGSGAGGGTIGSKGRTGTGLTTDDSHTLVSHGNGAQRVNEKGQLIDMSYPPHVAACIRALRPALKHLRVRVAPGVSMAQMLVMGLYFVVLLYPSFYQSSPFTDPLRAGWVCVGQLPFVFAFAAKNNLFGVFLGYGYEKLNFLHRFVGRLVVLAANVHALGYIYKWSLEGTFTKLLKRSITTWGFIGLLCLDLLVLFSTAWFRQRFYNIFYITHVISFIVLLPAVWLHMPPLLPYVFVCLGLYTLDYTLRILKTRLPRAIIRPLPELGVTRIEIPHLNAGWRAGQHVRIRIVSSGMGWWGWAEMHPFTIASVSGSQEGLVLMCKKTGKWTTDLFELAKSSGYVDGGMGRDVRVMVEGPYGGAGHAIFSSYSATVFVVGGSGITFALGAVQDLIQKDLNGRSRVKVIEIIWMIQDPAALIPLLPLLTTMVEESLFTPVRISIYYTRAPIGKFPFTPDFFHPSLTLSPGRPRIGRMLESVISRAVTLEGGPKDSEPITGLLVGVCGPVELGDDVAESVGSVDPVRRNQVGGIEIHEEVFGW